MQTAALIVAAGRGTRLGADLPKQYLPLGEAPVLRRTVRAFLDHPAIDRVLVVIGPDDLPLYRMAVGDLDLPAPVTGGASRQASVLNGLLALQDHGIKRVLIHDGARPFVDSATIDRVLGALDDDPGALPCIPVVDSLKRGAGDMVAEPVTRDGLWRAQTPQGFRFAEILAAHEAAAGLNLTDDVEVAQRAGLAVRMVEGTEANFKITTADDMERAQAFVRESNGASVPADIRTGSGFDVHRYADGRPMIICGITLPHPRGLLGHSDADVGLHAITDALLGAIAAGDIGDHFPPTEPRWKGEPSDTFLRFAGDLVRRRGGTILSIDITIICETPKIKPHREAMRNRIGEILGLDVERISVKATTTEKLGFTGRAEGIAAQAVATVRMGPAG
ncbi:MAG: bifunctional 2-C-methyl-D-erythritol 4-phosphate cytidylyltransferase/2-C-methyl-D-erythritol 2,4-cyclodiphosphate synthase [Pseudomonadota bacterium]|nr:bifunctional 2-C-methyl-D-erythritol 4-phosphate cytidylyltransferase/2-C-methyl-D-erythritol 2,4-cyclodiphosphate synthase [Pseudomonadota bacterium]